MILTPKQQLTIIQNIDAIAEGSFDEKNLKDLLIDVREFVHSKSITRELGHFIAHYERSSGDYHSLFNLREATIELLEEHPVSGKIQTNVDFTVLSRDVYNTIFVAGLEQYHKFPDIKKPFMQKQAVQKLLKRAYRANGKTYALTDRSLIPALSTITKECLVLFSNRALLEPSVLIDSLNNDFVIFCQKYLPSVNFNDAIKRRGADVVLCILSLLQDATFVLFTGAKAKFELRVVGELMRSNQEELATGRTRLAIAGGRMGDHGQIGGGTLFISSYAEPRVSVVGIPDADMFPALPPVRTTRGADGILKLTRY